MAWGPHLAALKAKSASGKATPLDDAPELAEDLAWVWEAFHVLGNDRAIGMIEGPIPSRAIFAYERRHAISDDDERERFEYLLMMLDSEYLQQRSKQTPGKP